MSRPPQHASRLMRVKNYNCRFDNRTRSGLRTGQRATTLVVQHAAQSPIFVSIAPETGSGVVRAFAHPTAHFGALRVLQSLHGDAKGRRAGTAAARRVRGRTESRDRPVQRSGLTAREIPVAGQSEPLRWVDSLSP